MSAEPSPPYVVFETRAVEDRAASIEAGHFVHKDVHYAIITPAGTRDRIEKEAELWLKDLETGVQQERMPAHWLAAFRRAYEDWKANRETPEFGIPVGDWPGISPATVRTLQDIGLRTVEQVAEANEEAVARIGMGGRALKAKAQAFLDAASDTGKVAAELETLRAKITELETRDTEREEELKKLRIANKALSKAEA